MSDSGFQYEALLSKQKKPLTSRRLLSLLHRRGFDARSVRIREHPRSGRNRLFVVDGLLGRSWLAKQNLTFHGAETWFYREASSRFEGAAFCLFADGTEDVVVLEHFDTFPSLRELSGGDVFAALEKVVALAPHLARLHGLGQSLPHAAAANLPYPRLDPIELRFWVGLSPGAQRFVSLLQKRRLLCRTFQTALEASDRQSFVHGDLKFDNVLVGPQELLLLDWECSGIGALEWDLGAVIGSVLLLWIDRWAETFEDAARPTDRVSREVAATTAARFAEAYVRHARRSGQPVPTPEGLARHAVAWIVGRTWTESTFAASPVASHPLRLLVAEELARDPKHLFQDLAW